MIAPTQIRKPENWQDFEKLCKKLWGEVWDCSDTIQRNGRSGQNQCGVDVYGLPKGESSYYGIQCKGKDDYTKSQLSEAEVDTEIAKALNFIPKLKRLIFATTANKDVKIEQYIREKNIKHIQEGLFEIYLSSWEDIVDILEAHGSTYKWYVNNCQYKDASDIDVFFEWDKEITVEPKYIKKTTIYQYKEPNPYFNMALLDMTQSPMANFNLMPFNQPRTTDYRWCYFDVNIKNTGNTAIEDYVLRLLFDPDTTAEISDRFGYNNSFGLSDAAKAQINAQKDSRREVFAGREYCNVMEFIPKDKILVQENHKTFSIAIKPKDNADTIRVEWCVLSRDYKKCGELTINVSPVFEEKQEIKTVYDKSEMKEPITEILPKIIQS